MFSLMYLTPFSCAYTTAYARIRRNIHDAGKKGEPVKRAKKLPQNTTFCGSFLQNIGKCGGKFLLREAAERGAVSLVGGE